MEFYFCFVWFCGGKKYKNRILFSVTNVIIFFWKVIVKNIKTKNPAHRVKCYNDEERKKLYQITMAACRT